MDLFYLVVACCLVNSIISIDDDENESESDADGSGSGGVTSGTLEIGISDGPSLTSTSPAQLRQPKKKIAISGSIENYSKWQLELKQCEIGSGKMNVPLSSIHPGYREGFAGYMKDNASKSFHLQCSMSASDYLIHIMFILPVMKNESNWLAVAICPKIDSFCQRVNSRIMYRLNTDLVKSKTFSRDISPVKTCYGDFCFSGAMGVTHKPVTVIKVYPKKYKDLSRQVKVESSKQHWSDTDYQEFIKDFEKGLGQNSELHGKQEKASIYTT